MLSVLRNPSYRRLFSAQVIALVGTGLLTVALGLLAYDLAGSDAGAVLGTALTIKMAAYVLVAPVAAALLARMPRKAVLVGSDLLRAAMALCLPFITDVWQVYVVVFLLQSASATFTPAFQSLIPAVLPAEREYTKALSLSRLAYDMEALASPAAAALLLTVLSYNNLFLCTVAGFLFSAMLVTSTQLPRDRGEPAPPSPVLQRITLGARIFWRNRRLRSLLALNLVVAAPTALVIVNTVVYVREVLQRPETGFALALASFGIGSMIVALAVPPLLDRFGDRAVMLSGAAVVPLGLAGATMLTRLAAEDGWFLLLGLWFLLGAATSAIQTPSARLLRAASTEETRPYVFTAQFSLSHACYMLTYPLAGWVGAAAGLGWGAAALAIVAIIGSTGAFLSWRRQPAPGPAEAADKEQGFDQPAPQRTHSGR